jgi:hypothetical protein
MPRANHQELLFKVVLSDLNQDLTRARAHAAKAHQLPITYSMHVFSNPKSASEGGRHAYEDLLCTCTPFKDAFSNVQTEESKRIERVRCVILRSLGTLQ